MNLNFWGVLWTIRVKLCVLMYFMVGVLDSLCHLITRLKRLLLPFMFSRWRSYKFRLFWWVFFRWWFVTSSSFCFFSLQVLCHSRLGFQRIPRSRALIWSEEFSTIPPIHLENSCVPHAFEGWFFFFLLSSCCLFLLFMCFIHVLIVSFYLFCQHVRLCVVSPVIFRAFISLLSVFSVSIRQQKVEDTLTTCPSGQTLRICYRSLILQVEFLDFYKIFLAILLCFVSFCRFDSPAAGFFSFLSQWIWISRHSTPIIRRRHPLNWRRPNDCAANHLVHVEKLAAYLGTVGINTWRLVS